MTDVKTQVYDALCRVSENVSDAYPVDWAVFPCIQYMEEANEVYWITGNKESMSRIRYRIDIWHKISTSAAALEVDKEMASLGLKRIACSDVNDPSGRKHKVMRYEGIIDVTTQQVYQE